MVRLSRFFSVVVIFVFSAVLSSCAPGGGSGGNVESDPAPKTYAALSATIYAGDTYTDAEVSIDANGDSIVRTKLVILFKPTATKEQVDVLLARINAIITASIAGARSVSIRIPDPGTLANLETIIADINSESFVEGVVKAVIGGPAALPDNIDEGNTSHYEIIDNNLAVGVATAWNAKEAVTRQPTIIMMDQLGYGVQAGMDQLNNNLDADISGTIYKSPDNSGHGFHVAGIMTASYGGDGTTPGLVTGVFPDRSTLNIVDMAGGFTTFDAMVKVLILAATADGTSVFNSSWQWFCDESSNLTDTCHEEQEVMLDGIIWADLVRAAGVEDRMFHATAAGNRMEDTYDKRDARTQGFFTTAALMTDMVTADGVAVPPLTNTVVVENLVGTSGFPRSIKCLSENSFIGGHIGGIGTDVTSLVQISADKMSGTSMSTPQVAGLAAYMLAIDPTLTPQQIKNILLATSQPVPSSALAECSDVVAAPAINAYAAILALDKATALSGSVSNAPVRNAILDISNDGITLDTNNKFDEFDLMYYIQQIDDGTQAIKDGTEVLKYSRADLNGDGYDGGVDGYKEKFNLDINFPPTYTTVKQMIENIEVEFNENSLTDNDILCYYAYSELYTGSETERTNLMASRCKPGVVAVYYSHFNEINFPGSNSECTNTNNDVSDERETLTQRPDFTVNPVPERPDGHFWRGGDSNTDNQFFEATTTRITDDPSGAAGNCNRQQSYYAYSGLDSTLAVANTGDSFTVDITATSASECWDMIPESPTWECSTATSRTSWAAEYDFKISAATKLNLILNFICTGANMTLPSLPGIPSTPSMDLTYSVLRVDANGDALPTNRDNSKLVVPQFFACNNDSNIINLTRLMEFDAPLNTGDVDRIIISVTGGAGAFGHLGNAFYLTDPLNIPVPTDGRQSNTTTMKGTVELKPAN